MRIKKMLFRMVSLLAIIFLSLISLNAKEQPLTINSCPVQDFTVIKTGNGWSFDYNREFYDDATVAWGKELLLNPGGWKKHPTIAHINGYNGDINLKISAPGPITEFSIGAQLVNYADAETRKGVISYSINGTDYNVIAEKDFGAGDTNIAGSQKLSNNKGLLWLRFSRIIAKNDSNGQSGNVVFKMMNFKLKGVEKQPPPAAQTLILNNCPVQDFTVIKTGNGWSFDYNREFYDDATVAWGKELLLNPGGWKKHPTIAHINGYNGDINLKISAPGPITEFSIGAQLVNYADAETRKGVISYSINGTDYNVIAEKDFGAGDTNIAGSQKLSNNNGLLWLRFGRIIAKNDSNGQSGNVVFKTMNFKLNGSYSAEKQATPATNGL